jgi:hypothetical protein
MCRFQIFILSMSIHLRQAYQSVDRDNPHTPMKVGEHGEIKFHLDFGMLVTKATINGIRILSIPSHLRGNDHHHHRTKAVIARQRIIITSVAGRPVMLMMTIGAKRMRDGGRMGRGEGKRNRRGWRRKRKRKA